MARDETWSPSWLRPNGFGSKFLDLGSTSSFALLSCLGSTRGILHSPLLIGIRPEFLEYWMDRPHCHLLLLCRTIEDILSGTFLHPPM